MTAWETFKVDGALAGDPDITIRLRQTGEQRGGIEHGKPTWAYEVTDGAVTLTGDELAGWHDAYCTAADLAGFLAYYGVDAECDGDAPADHVAFGKRYSDALSIYANDVEESQASDE